MKRSHVLAVATLAVLPLTAHADFMDIGKSAQQSSARSGGGGGGNPSLGAGLSDGRIGSGLEEALRVGTQKAVATVDHPGGFLNDRNVHIPLPGPLERVRSGLALVGASSRADDLDQRIDRAAEVAAPKAAGIFGKAASNMTISDARSILTGPRDSATLYFKCTTTPELTAAMKPIIDDSLANVGALKSYNALTQKISAMPLGSSVNLDLSSYVVHKTLDDIFFYFAQQEAAIRTNPAARSTDLLRSVFR